jgi:tetratricopeptide (TPR) repeat protein
MKRLADTNSGDTVFLLTLALRIAPPVMLILLAVEYYFWGTRFLWFLVPDLAVTALATLIAAWLLGKVSQGAGAILFPSGISTPAPRQYSEQDALVIRGQYAEAADSYRAVIADEPLNVDARLRLGRLLEHECNDATGAEECYRRIRGLNPSPQQDWETSNALIDLYQSTGQRERLIAELGRMSRQYANTATGKNARRRLDDLNAEDAS